jgi:hypothetical protein
MKIIKLLAAFLVIVAAGCKKPELYPSIPEIKFKSVTTTKDASGFDTQGRLVISFTDGDGDIGYHSEGNGSPYDDPTSIYYNNFIVKQFSKVIGVWTVDTIDHSGRIPWLTPDGSNKALKGDIALDIFLPKHKIKDTLHYEVFIYDRALNQSNTVTTSDIIVTTH